MSLLLATILLDIVAKDALQGAYRDCRAFFAAGHDGNWTNGHVDSPIGIRRLCGSLSIGLFGRDVVTMMPLPLRHRFVIRNRRRNVSCGCAERRLSLVNCYSSCSGEPINPSAGCLPPEYFQLDWQSGNDAGEFSWRVNAKTGVVE